MSSLTTITIRQLRLLIIDLSQHHSVSISWAALSKWASLSVLHVLWVVWSLVFFSCWREVSSNNMLWWALERIMNSELFVKWWVWWVGITCIWWSWSLFMNDLNDFISEWRSSTDWWSASVDNSTCSHGLSIDGRSDLINLFFSVKVSSDDVIGLDERVEFSLQVFVLLSQQKRVLLESLVFSLKIKVPVHEGLIWVVDSLQIGVLTPLINLDAVVFSLHSL